MSEIRDDRRYTKEHEWVQRVSDDTFRIGITAHAQDQLGDVVFVELPEVGRELAEMEPVGVVESVKTVSDIFCPMAGKVAAVNDALTDAPERVNKSPYDEGWIFEITASRPQVYDDLLDAKAYEGLVASE